MLFEFGLEPVFYLNGQNKAAIYLKPGLHFGKNQGVLYNSYRDYYNFEIDPNNALYYSVSEPIIGWYYRCSFDFGIQFNMSRNLNIGIELGAFYGNPKYFGELYFENTESDPEFKLLHDYYSPNNRQNSLGIQGAFNLVYRFSKKSDSSVN